MPIHSSPPGMMRHQTIQRSKDNYNLSLDWYDSVQNVGYKRFYPTGAHNSAGNLYYLSTEVNDADIFCKSDGDGCDIDFDITFNKPITIAAADAIFSFTTTNGNPNTNTIVITIYHVSTALAETSLGTVTYTVTSTANPYYLRCLTKCTLTEKAFAIGEKLRLNMTVNDNGGSSTVYFDPGSRQTLTESGTGATIGTDMIADIPIKVQS